MAVEACHRVPERRTGVPDFDFLFHISDIAKYVATGLYRDPAQRQRDTISSGIRDQQGNLPPVINQETPRSFQSGVYNLHSPSWSLSAQAPLIQLLQNRNENVVRGLLFAVVPVDF